MKRLTNHELARILLSQPELPVVLTYTDHTDWDYVTPLTQKFVDVGTVFKSELWEIEDEDNTDEDGTDEVNVSIIKFSEEWDTEDDDE